MLSFLLEATANIVANVVSDFFTPALVAAGVTEAGVLFGGSMAILVAANAESKRQSERLLSEADLTPTRESYDAFFTDKQKAEIALIQAAILGEPVTALVLNEQQQRQHTDIKSHMQNEADVSPAFAASLQSVCQEWLHLGVPPHQAISLLGEWEAAYRGATPDARVRAIKNLSQQYHDLYIKNKLQALLSDWVKTKTSLSDMLMQLDAFGEPAESFKETLITQAKKHFSSLSHTQREEALKSELYRHIALKHPVAYAPFVETMLESEVDDESGLVLGQPNYVMHAQTVGEWSAAHFSFDYLCSEAPIDALMRVGGDMRLLTLWHDTLNSQWQQFKRFIETTYDEDEDYRALEAKVLGAQERICARIDALEKAETVNDAVEVEIAPETVCEETAEKQTGYAMKHAASSVRYAVSGLASGSLFVAKGTVSVTWHVASCLARSAYDNPGKMFCLALMAVGSREMARVEAAPGDPYTTPDGVEGFDANGGEGGPDLAYCIPVSGGIVSAISCNLTYGVQFRFPPDKLVPCGEAKVVDGENGFLTCKTMQPFYRASLFPPGFSSQFYTQDEFLAIQNIYFGFDTKGRDIRRGRGTAFNVVLEECNSAGCKSFKGNNKQASVLTWTVGHPGQVVSKSDGLKLNVNSPIEGLKIATIDDVDKDTQSVQVTYDGVGVPAGTMLPGFSARTELENAPDPTPVSVLLSGTVLLDSPVRLNAGNFVVTFVGKYREFIGQVKIPIAAINGKVTQAYVPTLSDGYVGIKKTDDLPGGVVVDEDRGELLHRSLVVGQSPSGTMYSNIQSGQLTYTPVAEDRLKSPVTMVVNYTDGFGSFVNAVFKKPVLDTETKWVKPIEDISVSPGGIIDKALVDNTIIRDVDDVMGAAGFLRFSLTVSGNSKSLPVPVYSFDNISTLFKMTVPNSYNYQKYDMAVTACGHPQFGPVCTEIPNRGDIIVGDSPTTRREGAISSSISTSMGVTTTVQGRGIAQDADEGDIRFPHQLITQDPWIQLSEDMSTPYANQGRLTITITPPSPSSPGRYANDIQVSLSATIQSGRGDAAKNHTVVQPVSIKVAIAPLSYSAPLNAPLTEVSVGSTEEWVVEGPGAKSPMFLLSAKQRAAGDIPSLTKRSTFPGASAVSLEKRADGVTYLTLVVDKAATGGTYSISVTATSLAGSLQSSTPITRSVKNKPLVITRSSGALADVLVLPPFGNLPTATPYRYCVGVTDPEGFSPKSVVFSNLPAGYSQAARIPADALSDYCMQGITAARANLPVGAKPPKIRIVAEDAKPNADKTELEFGVNAPDTLPEMTAVPVVTLPAGTSVERTIDASDVDGDQTSFSVDSHVAFSSGGSGSRLVVTYAPVSGMQNTVQNTTVRLIANGKTVTQELSMSVTHQATTFKRLTKDIHITVSDPAISGNIIEDFGVDQPVPDPFKIAWKTSSLALSTQSNGGFAYGPRVGDENAEAVLVTASVGSKVVPADMKTVSYRFHIKVPPLAWRETDLGAPISVDRETAIISLPSSALQPQPYPTKFFLGNISVMEGEPVSGFYPLESVSENKATSTYSLKGDYGRAYHVQICAEQLAKVPTPRVCALWRPRFETPNVVISVGLTIAKGPVGAILPLLGFAWFLRNQRKIRQKAESAIHLYGWLMRLPAITRVSFKSPLFTPAVIGGDILGHAMVKNPLHGSHAKIYPAGGAGTGAAPGTPPRTGVKRASFSPKRRSRSGSVGGDEDRKSAASAAGASSRSLTVSPERKQNVLQALREAGRKATSRANVDQLKAFDPSTFANRLAKVFGRLRDAILAERKSSIVLDSEVTHFRSAALQRQFNLLAIWLEKIPPPESAEWRAVGAVIRTYIETVLEQGIKDLAVHINQILSDKLYDANREYLLLPQLVEAYINLIAFYTKYASKEVDFYVACKMHIVLESLFTQADELYSQPLQVSSDPAIVLAYVMNKLMVMLFRYHVAPDGLVRSLGNRLGLDDIGAVSDNQAKTLMNLSTEVFRKAKKIVASTKAGQPVQRYSALDALAAAYMLEGIKAVKQEQTVLPRFCQTCRKDKAAPEKRDARWQSIVLQSIVQREQDVQNGVRELMPPKADQMLFPRRPNAWSKDTLWFLADLIWQVPVWLTPNETNAAWPSWEEGWLIDNNNPYLSMTLRIMASMLLLVLSYHHRVHQPRLTTSRYALFLGDAAQTSALSAWHAVAYMVTCFCLFLGAKVRCQIPQYPERSSPLKMVPALQYAMLSPKHDQAVDMRVAKMLVTIVQEPKTHDGVDFGEKRAALRWLAYMKRSVSFKLGDIGVRYIIESILPFCADGNLLTRDARSMVAAFFWHNKNREAERLVQELISEGLRFDDPRGDVALGLIDCLLKSPYADPISSFYRKKKVNIILTAIKAAFMHGDVKTAYSYSMPAAGRDRYQSYRDVQLQKNSLVALLCDYCRVHSEMQVRQVLDEIQAEVGMLAGFMTVGEDIVEAKGLGVSARAERTKELSAARRAKAVMQRAASNVSISSTRSKSREFETATNPAALLAAPPAEIVDATGNIKNVPRSINEPWPDGRFPLALNLDAPAKAGVEKASKETSMPAAAVAVAVAPASPATNRSGMWQKGDDRGGDYPIFGGGVSSDSDSNESLGSAASRHDPDPIPGRRKEGGVKRAPAGPRVSLYNTYSGAGSAAGSNGRPKPAVAPGSGRAAKAVATGAGSRRK